MTDHDNKARRAAYEVREVLDAPVPPLPGSDPSSTGGTRRGTDGGHEPQRNADGTGDNHTGDNHTDDEGRVQR